MKTYYECHVTFRVRGQTPGDRETFPKLRGWKLSSIDGDPVLGDGVKHYLTAHFHEETPILRMVGRMKDVTQRLEMSNYFEVLRMKIEHVVYDSKQHEVVL